MIFKFLILVFLPIITLGNNDLEIFRAIDESVAAFESKSKESYFEDKKACYEEIGCFTATTGPMKHIGDLPATPTKINTKFFGYVSSGPTTAHEIAIKDAKTHSVVVQNQSLAVVIHGFGNNGQNTDLLKLKDSLLKFGHVSTVVVVDWAKGAATPWYTEAALNTQIVGRQIAVLVNHLKTSRGIQPANVHLLGFSLGAQVAGFAGKFSQTEFKWKFGRISALDAAAPLFEGYAGSFLNQADATFVDAIHSSAGNDILSGDVGFIHSIANVDFFPNGGVKQPRCEGSLAISCNHYSSVLYMEASLSASTKCHFTAFKCDSWGDFSNKTCKDTKGDSRMGYASASLSGRGNHYLKTTKEYPFC